MDSCEECGFEGDQVALTVAIHALAEFPAIASELLLDASEGSLRRPPRPGAWSPLEYGAHIGEAVEWYHARISRALTHHQPRFLPFDWDAACRERRYNERATPRVIADVERSCASLAADLRVLPPPDWQRFGIGSDGSRRSVAELARRAAHEVVHHSQDMSAGLHELQEPWLSSAAPGRGVGGRRQRS